MLYMLYYLFYMYMFIKGAFTQGIRDFKTRLPDNSLV